MPFNLSDFPEAFDAPDWLTKNSAWIYHIPMVPVFLKLLRPRIFVELGTFRGDSYMAFCQAIKKIGSETQCVAVDTWQGDDHAGHYGPEILGDLKKNHDPAYHRFSRLLQTDFDTAAKIFPDRSIDLLHIDGLHTYEAVKHDYETWLPKLSSRRAVVLFHDTAIFDRGFGVHQFWAEISANRPHFNVSYGCGLGILAAGSNVPREFLDFLTHLNAHHETLLPQFAALGHRNLMMRNCMMMVSKFHDAQEILNTWRTYTGQAIKNPTPNQTKAWEDPVAFATLAVKDVGQLTADALQLLSELTPLRKGSTIGCIPGNLGAPKPVPA